MEDDKGRFLTDSLVKRFHEMAAPSRSARHPGKDDWERAFMLAEQLLPRFYTQVHWERLNDRECKILLLLAMGMKNPEIKALLPGLSDQMVSNLKAGINQKLFGDHGARSLEVNLAV